MTLAESYKVLQHGTLWSSTGRCKGYAVANPREADKVDAYIAALARGERPAPPVLATDTGRGIVGMLDALASLVAASFAVAVSGDTTTAGRLTGVVHE